MQTTKSPQALATFVHLSLAFDLVIRHDLAYDKQGLRHKQTCDGFLPVRRRQPVFLCVCVFVECFAFGLSTACQSLQRRQNGSAREPCFLDRS